MNKTRRTAGGLRRAGSRVGLAATVAAMVSGLAVAAVAPASAAVAAPVSAAAAAPASAAAAALGGSRVALPDPVPAWTQYATDEGPAGADVSVPVRVYLAGRSPRAEVQFASSVSTPGQAGYGRYLSPAQFAARFGSTPGQVTAVESWATSAGLTVTGRTAHYIALAGTAPKLSQALGTSIHSYRNSSSGLSGYAPVSGISVPQSIGADVATVTGLDGYSFPAADGPLQRTPSAGADQRTTTAPAAADPTAFACSAWWGQHSSAIPAADGRTRAPNAVCGYTPQQLRSAYGVAAGSGQGATIAIVLDGSLATMQADANRFFSSHGLPGFSPGQFTVNTAPGFAASCGGASDVPEEPLDVETAHIVAPAAKIVYVAANCSDNPQLQQQNLLDAETRIVDQHLADVSTDSYSILENGDFTPATAAAWTQIFEQGAAEGTGFNFDSGDGGDNANGGGAADAGVTFPASDPWATAVGGTTLEIGKTGTVTGELGWGDDGAEENRTGTGYVQAPPGTFEEGSTGGRSSLFAEPAYQRGVVPTSLSTAGGTGAAHRVVPDVAADASPMTGWLIGFTTPGSNYATQLEGGTSGSSPIVAALEADAKQGAGHAIGFADPLLYDLRTTDGIRDVVPSAAPALTLAPDCYNDQVQPNPACLVTLGLDSSLAEAPGYDDVTGVGAVTGKFISALATADNGS